MIIHEEVIIHEEGRGYHRLKIIPKMPSTWEIEAEYYVMGNTPVLWLDIFIGQNTGMGYVPVYCNLDTRPKFFTI